MCPLSNLKLCVFPSLAAHNPPALLEAGLVATVNSDDLAYFGGYINANFIQDLCGPAILTARHAWQLAHNSFEADFARRRKSAPGATGCRHALSIMPRRERFFY